jgi:RNA-binding protein
MIGKDEVTPAVIASIDDYLTAHEIVKVQIQDGAILDPKETANEIAEELGAEFVQAIGRKFVLYRQAADPDKRKIILL